MTGHDVAAAADESDLARRSAGPCRRISGRKMPMRVGADEEPELHAARGGSRAHRERPPRSRRTSFGRRSRGEPLADDAALLVGEPRHVLGRSASSHSRLRPTKTTGRPSRRNSHCHPARPPMPSMPSSQSGDRAADDRRHRDRHHEPRDDARAVLRREPRRQVERHAREEAGFGGAEQQPQHVEAVRTDRERSSPPTPGPTRS